MNGVFVSSMLFVNYEIMLCNVFKLLNVIIGLVIMFGVIFCSTYGASMYLQNYIWLGFCLTAVSLSGQEQINRPYRPVYLFRTVSNLKIRRFRLVSTGLSRYTGYRYRCPNSAGRPFGPWHGTILARSKHGPARSVTGPGRHDPFSVPGMGSYGGPRALARPGTIYGLARRLPAI